MHARSQEAGLKVKEYELLRKNFSDTGNFGARLGRVIVQHKQLAAASRRGEDVIAIMHAVALCCGCRLRHH